LNYFHHYQLLNTSEKSNLVNTNTKKTLPILKWNSFNFYNYKIKFSLKTSFKFFKNIFKKNNNLSHKICLINEKIPFKKSFLPNTYFKNLSKSALVLKTSSTNKNNFLKKNAFFKKKYYIFLNKFLLNFFQFMLKAKIYLTFKKL